MTAGPDPDGPGASLLGPLLAQPRVNLAHRLGDDVLIEADLVRDGRSDPVPYIMGYSAGPEAGPVLEHAYAGSSSVTVLDADSYTFLSDRRGGWHPSRSLWRHRRGPGREPDLLLSVPGGVMSYAAAGGTAVAAVWTQARQQATEKQAAHKQAAHKHAGRAAGTSAMVVRGDLWPRSSYRSDDRVLGLVRVPVEPGITRAPRPVNLGPGQLGPDVLLTGELALTPDGRRCAAGLVRFLQGGHVRYGLLVFSLAETADPGAARAVWAPDDDLVRPVAAPDGRWFACTAERIAVPGLAPRQEAVLVAADGSGIERVAPWHRDWLQPRAWTAQGDLLCLGEQDGRRRLWRVRPDDARVERIELEGSVLAVTAAGGEALVVRSAIDLPPEVIAVPAHGRHSERPLVAPARTAGPGGRMERLTYHAPDGSSWHSWLCLPHEDQPEPQRPETLPVLIWCHGGPLLSWTDWSWRWNPWPFVAEGYAVLMPDPPLSVGYGQDAVERGWGRWTSEVTEVAAAQVMDALADPGLDAGRVAVMGGSFGGFLALALGARLPGVRLVASHAGWADFAAVARASDLYWHWLREYGAVGTSDSYRQESLSLDAFGAFDAVDALDPGVRVLLSHGCGDRHVPVGEARAMYRSLDTLGIDTELMLFPDEGHSIRKPANVTAWYRWVLAACREALGKEPAGKEAALL